MKKLFCSIAAFIVFIIWFGVLSITVPFVLIVALFDSFEFFNKFNLIVLVCKPERFIYFCFDYLLDKSFL